MFSLNEILKNLFPEYESSNKLNSFLSKNKIDIDTFNQKLKEKYSIEYVDLDKEEISLDLFKNFDIKKIKEYMMIPYKKDNNNKNLFIAVYDFSDIEKINEIKDYVKNLSYTAIFKFSPDYKIKEIYDSFILNDVKVWVDNVIQKGIDINASDIHIEPFENYLQVRYRVDGILTGKKIYRYKNIQISSIIVRIKILSNMDISEKRKPQDGRIYNYLYKNSYYDIRVSCVTTIYGEKIVLRIMPKTTQFITFKDLGFNNNQENKIKDMIHSKNGIIYLSGTTGSGKTTTLYTILNILNSDKRNIYTIENPVERTIKNINQIEINDQAGITYISMLRSILRQDPDIIVIGEIRDSETASMAVRASLTGHLVLTTIHGNSAADSIERLIDIGVDPCLISASTIGFLSQKLIRRVCPYCRKKVEKLKPYERLWLNKNGFENCDDDEFYEAVGCDKCLDGYKGRIALAEILETDEKIRKLISEEAPVSEIKKQAFLNGFKPFIQDGVEKAKQGLTTVSELMGS